MSFRQAVSDIGIGLIGGYAGTKVMEQASMKLYELESGPEVPTRSRRRK